MAQSNEQQEAKTVAAKLWDKITEALNVLLMRDKNYKKFIKNMYDFTLVIYRKRRILQMYYSSVIKYRKKE